MNNATSILGREREIRQQARALLADSALAEVLGEYGDVEVGGSYAYKLMCARDLDFSVVARQPAGETTVLRCDATNFIQRCPWAQRIHMSDRARWPASDRPAGVWVGLDVPWCGYQWRIDVWFLLSRESRGPGGQLKPNTLTQLSQLSAEDRTVILMIKECLAANYDKHLPSSFVYKAVIEDGIRSMAEFEKWLRSETTDVADVLRTLPDAA